MTMRRLGLVLLTVLATACTTDSPATTSAPPPPTTRPSTTTTPNTTAPPTSTTIPQAALDIRAALDGYTSALAAADGDAALDHVDAGTLDLFDDLLLLAAAPVHVDEMEFIDALLVLRLRLRFTAEELNGLSAAQVFVTAIEEELLLPTPGASITFEAINVTDDEATGEVGGSPAMWFVREDGNWKVALGRTFEEYAPVLGLQLEQAAQEAAGSGATRAEALLALLASIEGAEVDPDLLAGPAG